MRATVIIRTAEKGGRIVKLVELSSIDEVTVRESREELQAAFPGYYIDLSQVDLARQAMAA